MSKFTKAKKSQAKLRMALIGVSGSGKSWTALEVARHLGKRVAVIDTERSSASKYADKFNFDSLNLEHFAPANYVSAIKAAADEKYDVLVIDSLSHAWMGVGGALEMADNASKKGGNRFTAWRDVTPEQNKLVDAILGAPMHVIVTMRAKAEYSLDKDDKGKVVPKKIGMQAIQRENSEFDYDVVGDMTIDNDLIVSKTRCSELAGKVYHKPGEEFAGILVKWLSDGEPEPEKPKTVPAMPAAIQSARQDLIAAAEVIVAESQPLGPPADQPSVEFAKAVALWTSKINETDSVAKLKTLGSLLSGLPMPVQKALSDAYRQQMKKLETP